MPSYRSKPSISGRRVKPSRTVLQLERSKPIPILAMLDEAIPGLEILPGDCNWNLQNGVNIYSNPYRRRQP